MSWITRILHLDEDRSEVTDEEIEEQKRRAQIASQQAVKLHEDVVIPLAREAQRSIGVNHYADAMARAWKPPRTGGA